VCILEIPLYPRNQRSNEQYQIVPVKLNTGQWPFLHEQPSLLYCDNDLTRYIAANSVFHERTKNIEIDCHIIREKLKKGLIHLLHISITKELADIYTKALGPQSFKNICFKLGLINICSPTCGGLSEDMDTRLIEGD